ncbi:MAG: YbaK/EbsC family protein [bacterium]|nr:YbaK/EbsC family protein [bacterium]
MANRDEGDFLAHAKAMGLTCDVRTMPESTHSAADAARAIGCEVHEIAKSIVLLSVSQQVILAVLQGTKRASLPRIAELLGEDVKMASAKQVRRLTGYVIGGVPPFGHDAAVVSLLDTDVLELPIVWAAAGSQRAVFSVNPSSLVDAMQARVASLG